MVLIERTSAKCSAAAASLGRCSEMRRPGTLVAISLKLPPFSCPGFRSKVSIWLGPPFIHSNMQARLRGVTVSLSPARAARLGKADAPVTKKIAIDLVKLTQLSGQPFEMLTRFLKMIQVQRQDFNGKVITVRGDDTRAIAAMLDVPVDQCGERLDALDLLFHA